MERAALIEMRDMNISLGGSTILHNIDLVLHVGERTVILGPNGSGKSSLIKVMMGEHRYDTSRPGSMVRIRGEEHWDIFDVRRAFGLVSGDLQEDLKRDINVLDAVISGLFGSVGTNRSQNIDPAMEERAHLSLALVRSEHLASRRVNTLSSGEARRVLMARALVNDPQALILDEPMNSLDLTGKSLVREAMRSLVRSGRSIILVTHDPSDIIPEMDRLIMMKEGRIFKDGGMELLNDSDLSELYDVPIRLSRDEGRYWALY